MLQARLTRRIPGPAGKLQRLQASHAQGGLPGSSNTFATDDSEDLMDPDFQSKAWQSALSCQGDQLVFKVADSSLLYCSH